MTKFHKELDKEKKDILRMGRLAQDMLKKSVIALKEQDVEMAEWVLAKGEKIRYMDDEIEEDLLRFIALYQPVAKDMRLIACGLKMITYMARIGRYGRDIAKIAKELANEPHLAKLVSIPTMAEIANKMVSDSLKAFQKGDISLLKDFAERDDTLDAMRYSIFRECVTFMMESPNNISRCSNYVMVARYIERCGDHACKMAEKIHYMVTGERIEIS
jgi:phosphate transport system protein